MAKLKKKVRRNLLIFISVGIVVLVGCVVTICLSRKPNKRLEEEEVKPQPEEVVKKVQVINEESKSRPYAVMINNNSAVWKYQSGMNQAYIVYEMLVEGGITREMALFRDADVAKIQSVRSSRHYFLDYALENDAIYVHWGWSPRAQSEIPSRGVNNINGLTYEGTYFFRDKTVKAGLEHRGYTKMESLLKATERLKYRTTTDKGVLLNYDVDSLDLSSKDGVIDAKYVEVPYSGSYRAKFFYDEESKMYKKSQNNTEMFDYTSKERYVTKNIIIYNVGYSAIDSYGRLDMQNTGNGDGYFISEGKAVPITWSKSSKDSRTTYKYADGTPLIVNDGTTYIGLQPKGKSPVIKDSLLQ